MRTRARGECIGGTVSECSFIPARCCALAWVASDKVVSFRPRVTHRGVLACSASGGVGSDGALDARVVRERRVVLPDALARCNGVGACSYPVLMQQGRTRQWALEGLGV